MCKFISYDSVNLFLVKFVRLIDLNWEHNGSKLCIGRNFGKIAADKILSHLKKTVIKNYAILQISSQQ